MYKLIYQQHDSRGHLEDFMPFLLLLDVFFFFSS